MLRLLAAKAKALDQTLVLGQIFTLDVIKKLAAQSHHLQQPAAGRNIMFIRAQVFGQCILNSCKLISLLISVFLECI